MQQWEFCSSTSFTVGMSFIVNSFLLRAQGSDGLGPIDFNGDDSDFTPYSTPYTTPQKVEESSNPTPISDNVIKALFK